MGDNNQPSKIRKGAIILAGGDSKRLGQPKALLDFNGQPLIEVMVKRLSTFFQEITIVTDRSDLYGGLPVRLISDELNVQQKSPLRGIHAGLNASDLPYQFVVACDMPMLNLDLINYMARFAPDYDAVVPRIGNYFQPLHSYYRRNCINVIEKQVLTGFYKVTDFYANLKVRFISEQDISRFDPEQKSFININTWSDYEQALSIYLKENNKFNNGGDRHAENT